MGKETEERETSIFVGSLEDFMALLAATNPSVGDDADFQKACDECEDDDRCIACGNLLPSSAEDCYCYICHKSGIAERFEELLCDRASLASQLETANSNLSTEQWQYNTMIESKNRIIQAFVDAQVLSNKKIAKLKKRLRGQVPTEVSL